MSIRWLGATLLVAVVSLLASSTSFAQDWGGRQKFAASNAALATPAEGQPRVVLMGDSITEIWPDRHPVFFEETGFIGRGISGQVSAQMLVRFRQDVIALRPTVVVINAGTNDVAENQGPYDEGFTLGNIISMTELAQANGIAVVLTSVLPAAGFRWRPAITDAADKIAALNSRIRAYAEAQGIPYVDYYSALVVDDPSRALNPTFSNDGVHPVAAGYEVMEPLLLEAIHKALESVCLLSGDCACCR